MADEQDKWLDDQLEHIKKVKPRHTVMFQHIPWFLSDPEEDDQYFNIDKETRIKMLDKFNDAGNI